MSDGSNAKRNTDESWEDFGRSGAVETGSFIGKDFEDGRKVDLN